jgi:hypothetical protein
LSNFHGQIGHDHNALEISKWSTLLHKFVAEKTIILTMEEN